MTLGQAVMIAVLFLFTVRFASELREFSLGYRSLPASVWMARGATLLVLYATQPLLDALGRFLASFYAC